MPSAPSTKTAVRKTAVSKPAAKKSVVPSAAAKKTPARKTPAPKAADDVPSFRFYPAKDLHHRLVALLDHIERASDATAHRTQLSESVSELTAAGFDYYFAQTLKEAKAGFVTQQTATIGLAGVKQVMAPVIRNVVGRLEHAQIQAIAKSIRAFMQ